MEPKWRGKGAIRAELGKGLSHCPQPASWACNVKQGLMGTLTSSSGLCIINPKPAHTQSPNPYQLLGALHHSLAIVAGCAITRLRGCGGPCAGQADGGDPTTRWAAEPGQDQLFETGPHRARSIRFRPRDSERAVRDALELHNRLQEEGRARERGGVQVIPRRARELGCPGSQQGPCAALCATSASTGNCTPAGLPLQSADTISNSQPTSTVACASATC